MEYVDVYSQILRWLWMQGPIYLVWLLGIIWAALTFKRHPRKSFLVMLVLVAFLVEALALPFLSHYLLDLGQGGGIDFEKQWMILEFCRAVVNAGLWLLLLAALFLVDRPPAAPRGPDGELLPPNWAPDRKEPVT